MKPTLKRTVPRRCAFTLIELLIVIAIIAILSALLLPVFHLAQSRAQRTVCLDNVRQINLAIRIYCDDFNGEAPIDQRAKSQAQDLGDYGVATFFSYRRLIHQYVGLGPIPSPRDKLFTCPADTFSYGMDSLTPLSLTYLTRGFHENTNTGCSSYSYNGGLTNLFSLYTNTIGLQGVKLDTITQPDLTVLDSEASALFPFSWHQPGNASAFGAVMFNNGAVLFDDARNMVGFVDGHVNYIKIFWNPTPVQPGDWGLAIQYNPPAGYAYKWSGN
jgi:prepilin-type N-terminal cleavage/methylation domain-containing protein